MQRLADSASRHSFRACTMRVTSSLSNGHFRARNPIRLITIFRFPVPILFSFSGISTASSCDKQSLSVPQNACEVDSRAPLGLLRSFCASPRTVLRRPSSAWSRSMSAFADLTALPYLKQSVATRSRSWTMAMMLAAADTPSRVGASRVCNGGGRGLSIRDG